RPYDLPSAPEIAIFMPDAEAAVGRDVVVEGKNGPLRSIDEASSVYDPLRYILLHPRGEEGWTFNV
ncbi:hypothetical protein EDD21DRAFT_289285, partial [Dissophora ornata]